MWLYITAGTPRSAAIYHFLLVLLSCRIYKLAPNWRNVQFSFPIYFWLSQAILRSLSKLRALPDVTWRPHAPWEERGHSSRHAPPSAGREAGGPGRRWWWSRDSSWPGDPATTVLQSIQGLKGEGWENIQQRSRSDEPSKDLGILLGCRCWCGRSGKAWDCAFLKAPRHARAASAWATLWVPILQTVSVLET